MTTAISINPCEWKPEKLEDFIGKTLQWGKVLSAVARRASSGSGTPLKYLLSGPPGVGKTELCLAIARLLTDVEHDIEVISCRSLNASSVAALNSRVGSGSLYGKWIVVILDEADTCPRDGQDALLTFLDKLPRHRAVLATSNLEIGDLTERFQTRFQHLPCEAPDEKDIAVLLSRFEQLSAEDIERISEDSGGNVRQALLDAQTQIDFNQFSD